jgi:hypothetical protein
MRTIGPARTWMSSFAWADVAGLLGVGRFEVHRLPAVLASALTTRVASVVLHHDGAGVLR